LHDRDRRWPPTDSASLALVDRQATFLLALGLLIAAAAVVSAAGWILFLRDRRADRTSGPSPERSEPEATTEAVGTAEPPAER
jgi:hypothetical protein